MLLSVPLISDTLLLHERCGCSQFISNIWKTRHKPWMALKEDEHITGTACGFFPGTAGWQVFHGVKGHTFFCVSGYSLHIDRLSLMFVFTHITWKLFPLTAAELRINWLATNHTTWFSSCAAHHRWLLLDSDRIVQTLWSE